MSSEGVARGSQASQGRLREDGLQQRGDELTEQPPLPRSGQAAAERGESSSSSISGSSKRIINR
jgi:hypothetical protein